MKFVQISCHSVRAVNVSSCQPAARGRRRGSTRGQPWRKEISSNSPETELSSRACCPRRARIDFFLDVEPQQTFNDTLLAISSCCLLSFKWQPIMQKRRQCAFSTRACLAASCSCHFSGLAGFNQGTRCFLDESNFWSVLQTQHERELCSVSPRAAEH